MLAANSKAKVTVANPTLAPTVNSDFAKVTTVAELAKLALTLETIAAETYQAETSMLSSAAAIGLSSSIQPVEMQHIAILYYVLGEYPGVQTAVAPHWPLARRTRPSNEATRQQDVPIPLVAFALLLASLSYPRGPDVQRPRFVP